MTKNDIKHSATPLERTARREAVSFQRIARRFVSSVPSFNPDNESPEGSMDESSPEATAANTWADYYDVADGDRAAHIAFYSGLLTDRTRSILELGCGTGTMVSTLAQRMVRRNDNAQAIRIVGVDASEGMLRV